MKGESGELNHQHADFLKDIYFRFERSEAISFLSEK